jgi:lupus La protein
MSGEVKATEAPANGNTDAEKDVQNLLSELKGEGEKPEQESKPEETADDEEARIIAAASKLGQESASKESKPEVKGRHQGDRKPRNYRDNIKSDLTSQETTDDPKEIRKQVCGVLSRDTPREQFF